MPCKSTDDNCGDCLFYSGRIAQTFFIFLPFISLQTVLYLNLRIGRESMNHQVLSGDLVSDASSLGARFRNDDPTGGDGGHSMDYRHVPLVDADDNRLDESLAPQAQQNLMV
jgi:hypothetical protein